MQIVFHIGAHQTDEGMLLRSLLKNSDLLLGEDIAVPGPSRYRTLIGEIVNSLRGQEPDMALRETLMDALLDVSAPDRLFLASDSFICVPERVLDEGRLYTRAFKTQWLRNLFPGYPAAFVVAIRNPATFVPALFGSKRMLGMRYADFIGTTDPTTLRWSEFIRRLRDLHPDCPIVVWCNEDTPLIWPEIMRMVTGLDPEIALEGEHDVLGQIMRRRGMRLLARFLDENPGATRAQRRTRILELLDDYANEAQMSVEIDLPGWTTDMVEQMTRDYDADVDVIHQIPGVTLLEP